MDVTLPNGVVIQGVPEGTNKYTIMEKAISSGLATEEDFGGQSFAKPIDEMSGLQRFQAGVGRGISATARKAADLVGLHEYKEGAGDEDLLKTGAGMAGNLTGEIAATLPVGSGVGTGLRGARALAGGARGTNALARTLGSPITRATVEGGATGALISDPGERGEGAAWGAGFGGILGTAGKLLGMGVRAGTINITDEARRLQDMTGTFIPLSQAAQPGIGKQFYEALLANLPGVGGKIRGQYKNAIEDLRRFAGEQAHPPRADLDILPEDSIQNVFKKLEDYWATAYDDIGSLPIKLFKAGGREFRIPKQVASAIQRASGGRFVIPEAGETVTGNVIIDLKRAADELLERIPKGSVLKRAQREELQAFSEYVDDVLRQNLNPSGKGKGQMAQIYQDYLEKNQYYKNYQDLVTAGATAHGDAAFSPAKLAQVTSRRAGTSGLSGGADDSLQELGRLGKETLPDFPSKQGLFQTVAALGLGGSAVAGFGAPTAVGMAGLIGAGRGMASESFQKLISGQKEVLKKYADALRRAGYTSRQIATVLGVENASGQ